MHLIWRDDLLSAGQPTASVTSAFVTEGALRLPTQSAGVGWRQGVESAAAFAQELAEAFHERLSVDVWCLACGASPDELADRPPAWDGLVSALEEASLEEAAAVLADLAVPTARADSASLVPPRVRAVRRLRPPLPRPCRVALALAEHDVGRGVRALGAQLGAGGALWWADRSLGFRCSLSAEGLSLRAHHPVIQDEIHSWCLTNGHDVEGP